MVEMPPVAVIGGSGFYSLLDDAQTHVVTTPFGETSDALTTGRLGGRDVVFVPRHGAGHRFAPHLVLLQGDDLLVNKVVLPLDRAGAESLDATGSSS